MRLSPGPMPLLARATRRLVVGATVAASLSPIFAVAAHAASDTTLLHQASTSGYPVGIGIYDLANVFGINPTGTITFTLFAPDDPTCARPPLTTSTKPVSGNGAYKSDSYVTALAGTYRWIASYSGDTTNAPATTNCADAAGQVIVSKRTPAITISASPLSPAGTLSATATLENSVGPAGATGTITFKLFGPNNLVCSGPPIFTSTTSVAGDGSYPSDPFDPGSGTFHWTVAYSGDANNAATGTYCTSPGATVTVAPRLSIPALVNDFNGDNRTDPAVYRPSNGTWYLRDIGAIAWGAGAGDVPVPADYNGDQEADVAIYRPSEATWYLRNIGVVVFGTAGDIPVPGDYNGDGSADVAVYRPANGTWYLRSIGTVAWGGVPGDIPVPGDYNGDGTTDVAIFRPSNGTWYLRNIGTVVWGRARGDIPVPGDYDGNRTTDVAIYRPADGTWYLRGIAAITWGGLAGDIPIPGDEDGDGDSDVGVYRRSTNTWLGRGVPGITWGTAGDIPLSLPHAILLRPRA